MILSYVCVPCSCGGFAVFNVEHVGDCPAISPCLVCGAMKRWRRT